MVAILVGFLILFLVAAWAVFTTPPPEHQPYIPAQTKMMTIVMPIMMTVMFANFASGLNLYYAVSNLVSLPQQWFINKSRQAEMAKRQVAAPVPAPAGR